MRQQRAEQARRRQGPVVAAEEPGQEQKITRQDVGEQRCSRGALGRGAMIRAQDREFDNREQHNGERDIAIGDGPRDHGVLGETGTATSLRRAQGRVQGGS